MKTVLIAACAIGILCTGSGAFAQNHNPNNQPGPAYDAGRHDGPGNDWNKGDRVPDQYRSHDNEVSDWRMHNLHRPARGYRWMRNGDRQYVLVSVRTGRIYETMSMGPTPMAGPMRDHDQMWRKGDRIDDRYFDNQYRVDYRHNRLPRPRNGHMWISVNNHYVLTDSRSRLVLDIR